MSVIKYFQVIYFMFCPVLGEINFIILCKDARAAFNVCPWLEPAAINVLVNTIISFVHDYIDKMYVSNVS